MAPADTGLEAALEASIRVAEDEARKRKRKADGLEEPAGDRAPESKSSRKAKAEPLRRYLAGQVEKSEAHRKQREKKKKKKKKFKRDSLSSSESSSSTNAVFQPSLARGETRCGRLI